MVIKYSEDGLPYREAPYTPEEEAELYRRLDRGPMTVLKTAPGLYQKATAAPMGDALPEAQKKDDRQSR
jgi:hypothetical protein